MAITGHCLCGKVSYSVDADPVVVLLCHCEDCRRQSGAAFSTNVVVPSAALDLEGESMKTYETVGSDSGAARGRIFCGDCGSPLVTTMADMEDLVVIKSGTLDDPSWVQPQFEIWTDSAHPWVHAQDPPARRTFPRSLRS